MSNEPNKMELFLFVLNDVAPQVNELKEHFQRNNVKPVKAVLICLTLTIIILEELQVYRYLQMVLGPVIQRMTQELYNIQKKEETC